MLKYCICCVSLGLIFLSSPKESNAQPTQANGRAKPDQTNAQPAVTPLNNSNSSIDNSANTASSAENEERAAKDETFKAAQLRQNEKIATATVFIAWATGLNVAYAIVAIFMLLAIKRQAKYAGEQVETMQGQLDAMKEQAGIMRESLAETRAQMEIAATAVRVAERSAIAAEQNARIAIEEARPHLGISAIVHRSDTEPTIEVFFQNVGGSQAIVSAEYMVDIFGSEPFRRNEAFAPFTIPPGNRTETRKIEGLDARQFDLVVRAGGGQLTLKITGNYEGVGGPFPIHWCRKWVTGRDPSVNSIDGHCDEAAENPS